MMEKRRLLIIPARAGSKRILNKNIRNFCGKPIIFYSIDLAIRLKIFDEIHVSTDSERIKEVVERGGVKIPFLRPKNLSDDFSTTIDVYKFVLNAYTKKGKYFDEVWTLLPCAPLLEEADLLKAYKLFVDYDSQFPVISIVKCDCNHSHSFELINNFLNFDDGKTLRLRSQDLKVNFKSAGAFGIFPATHIIERDLDSFSDHSLGYVISKENAIDIDDENDWRLAEIIFHGKRLV